MFNFIRNHQTIFPKWLHHPAFPSVMYESSNCFISSPGLDFWTVSFSYFGWRGVIEAILHCGFNLSDLSEIVFSSLSLVANVLDICVPPHTLLARLLTATVVVTRCLQVGSKSKDLTCTMYLSLSATWFLCPHLTCEIFALVNLEMQESLCPNG